MYLYSARVSLFCGPGKSNIVLNFTLLEREIEEHCELHWCDRTDQLVFGREPACPGATGHREGWGHQALHACTGGRASGIEIQACGDVPTALAKLTVLEQRPVSLVIHHLALLPSSLQGFVCPLFKVLNATHSS